MVDHTSNEQSEVAQTESQIKEKVNRGFHGFSQIMFTGVRVDNGKLVGGYFFQIWEKTYILWGTTNAIPNMFEVHQNTVSQYIGIDRNGGNIYLGSEVKLFHDRHDAQHGTVLYDEEEVCFHVEVGLEEFVPLIPREVEVIEEGI